MSAKAAKSKVKAKAKKPTSTKVTKVAQPAKPVAAAVIRISVVDNEPEPFKIIVRRKKSGGLTNVFRQIALPVLWAVARLSMKLARLLYRKLLQLGKWLYRTAKPQATKLKRQFLRIPFKVRLRVALVGSIILIFLGIFLLITAKPTPTPVKVTTISPAVKKPAKLATGTPNYKTVLPAGKSIQSLGGWTRVSPPNRNPVYAYVDKFGTVQIDVSEQPLPPNFKTDTANQIAQLAQSFSANEKVTVGDTIVYIGTSSNGPQSVILTKSNLLILIKSTSPLTDTQWSSYVSTLQ